MMGFPPKYGKTATELGLLESQMHARGGHLVVDSTPFKTGSKLHKLWVDACGAYTGGAAIPRRKYESMSFGVDWSGVGPEDNSWLSTSIRKPLLPQPGDAVLVVRMDEYSVPLACAPVGRVLYIGRFGTRYVILNGTREEMLCDPDELIVLTRPGRE